MIDPAAARRAADAVPSIPCNAEGPVFREPWEAQAFAMALALHERGLFTWQEWAATLGEEIKRAQAAGDPDTGETYYRHWLNTLERLVATKGVTDSTMLARYCDAWEHAAERTPHGTPIELKAEVLGREVASDGKTDPLGKAAGAISLQRKQKKRIFRDFVGWLGLLQTPSL